MSELQNAALRYAREGYTILPVHEPCDDGTCSCNAGVACENPGKHPRTKNGLRDATTDEAVIRSWWDAWPNASIAIRTGSGLAVIDLDGDEGLATLATLRDRVGSEQFETVTVQTGRGEHLWFKPVNGEVRNSAGQLGTGVDVRGEGGYIIVPPSRHASGARYAFEVGYGLDDRPMLPFPNGLLAIANDASPSSVADREDLAAIPRGRRNAKLASMAGTMRRAGFDTGAIRAALLKTNERCDPPLEEREVTCIARSIGNYTPAESTDGVPELVTCDAAELLARPYEPPAFAIKHLGPKVGVGLVTGDSGSGKTSFFLNTLIAAIAGIFALGRFATELSERPVLYLNGEMDSATLQRFLHANKAGLGVDIPKNRLLFQGEGGFADFFLARETGAARAFETMIAKLQPAIVVFDTQRAFFELDENDAAEVRRIFDWLRSLARKYECLVLIAHHLRKMGAVSNAPRERVSGSRDLIAAVDVHLALRSQSGRPVQALLLDKTRMPFEGVAAGTEWPIEAKWVDGEPPRSTFTAGEPKTAETGTSVEDAETELVAIVEAEGPQTVAQLKATGGSRKRAFENCKGDGRLVMAGKDGRAQRWDVPRRSPRTDALL